MIFTIKYVLWKLKPILVPRSNILKIIDLIKKKVWVGIQGRSNALYLNRWFTVPKKYGSRWFIQDLKPVNKVTRRNSGVGPMVDEFTEAFANQAIYSIRDLYFGKDHFQLVVDNQDITTMRSAIGLLWMCTRPQGAMNSVTHMINAMNKMLWDYIPEIKMPFLDDILMKGCVVEEKDETMDNRGCRMIVVDHIFYCEKVLWKLEDVHLTLSEEKSTFG